MNTNLSVIVPVFNEENAIEESVKSLLKIKNSNLDQNIEIIFVNDGSTDKTTEILKNLSRNEDQLKVVSYDDNRGYGAAIKMGVKHASSELIAITDADDTYPNHRLSEFLEMTIKEDYDMLVGSRVGKNVHIPMLRRLPKKCLNLLASYLSGKEIPDLNSGMRIMKKDLVEKFSYILPDGFSLTSTITLAMLTNGYNVKYEKIDYFPRKGFSKIRPIKDTLNFLILIVRTVLLFRPLKIFIPLSLILFIPGFVLFLSRIVLGEGFAISSIVLLLSSIQIMALGMLADLLNRKFPDR
jgi:glycosyltransferase involved in cell wall biosynthesis